MVHAPSSGTVEPSLLLVTKRIAHFEAMRNSLPRWRIRSGPLACDGLADVVLIDWTERGLPRRSEERPRFLRSALVIVSSSGTFDERADAVRAGADDFLVYSDLARHDLEDRLRAALLRHKLCVQDYSSDTANEGPPKEDNLRGTHRGIDVNLSTRTILIDGRAADLTRQQRAILLCLATTNVQRSTATQICFAAGIQPDVEFKNLRNQMSRLKRRLGDHSVLIEGSPRMGYRLQRHARLQR